ncbi:hypothetical protein [Pseudoalteromonas sp. S16_S37]|uniref:hypothetical protein n=1 Tax=Pseudoalteromonas sp. S16_S37 TaxID=2720228 RepID=UPI001681025A|nr:hypothetical protein [Pseudoalteromonas sp. S16_S37]MBD1582031.1 hypothetical protein [Pseudoalteromonas sp. S16_S37]
MNLKWLMVLACIFVLSCTEQTQNLKAPPAITLTSLLNNYETQLSKVQWAIYNGQSKEEILLYSNELYATAQTILALFSERQSKCTDYFAQLLPVSQKLKASASHMLHVNKSIQSALPPFNEPICYHLKELLVQAVLISSFNDQQVIRNEMTELSAHLAVVKHNLSKSTHL